MAYTFYVNMTKRKDGTVRSDLNKAGGGIYLDLREAQMELAQDIWQANKHTVELVALTRQEYDELLKGQA